MPSTNKLASHKSSRTTRHHVRESIAKFLLSFCGLASFGVVTTLIALSTNNVYAESSSNTITANLPGSVAIRLLDSTGTTEISSLDFNNLTPTPQGTTASKSFIVDVATSNPTGYKLYMQSDYQDSSNNYTTNLTHTDSDVADNIPTLVPGSGSSADTKVYWNYVNPLTSATSPIPAYGQPDKIGQYFTATENNQSTIDINVGIDTTIVSGTYENQLLFSAVGNPTTLSYSVSFDTDGGTMAGEDIEEAATAGTHSISIPDTSDYLPDKTGYAFSHWQITIPEGSGVTASCVVTSSSGDVVNNNTNGYGMVGNNGETVGDTRADNVCYPGDNITIHSAIDEKGDFIGNVGLTANYIRNAYELTVNPNGGVWQGSSSSQIVLGDEGSTTTIPDPSSTPTYTVTYDANGQGASYTASPTSVGTTFKNWSLTATSEGETRHGSFDSSTSTYTFGAGNDTMTANYSTNSFRLPSITKSGYKCGWAKDSKTGVKYAGGVDINIELVVTGDTTFYAVCTTANTIANITYMQNMTATICDNTFIGNTATLRDNRDNNYYTVKKLLDNRCWMTQNLRLIGSRTLTTANSDVTSNRTWQPEATCAAYAKMCASYHNNTTYGAYYNYQAAIVELPPATPWGEAGDASNSICPKGWRLPAVGEHELLSRSYSLSNELITSSSGPGFVPAGQYNGNELQNTGEYGYYLSSYHTSTYYVSSLFVNYYSYPRWGTSYHRTAQGSVRCIAK